MYGRITKYRSDFGIGVIKADNGQKFRFSKRDVTNSAGVLVGQDVDFVVVASRPAGIIMMTGSPWTAFGGLGGA